MGDLYLAPQPHRCMPPIDPTSGRVAARTPGSLWQCDDCGRIWEVAQCVIGGPFWIAAKPETLQRISLATTTNPGPQRLATCSTCQQQPGDDCEHFVAR